MLRPPSPLRRRMYILEGRDAELRLTSPPQQRGRKKMFIVEKINNHASRGEPAVSLFFSRAQLQPHFFPRFSANLPKFPNIR